MAHPKLAVPSSGLGGRGYKQIFGDGTPVPSITTALGALEKPGIVDWHISQTVAYAVTHVDELLSRTEEQGMRFMQYYSRRLNSSKVDEIDVYNYSKGVLEDLADLGDFIHDWIEADLNGWIPEDPWRDDQAEMVMAYLDWKETQFLNVVATETTVFGNYNGFGYAGTFDIVAEVNGETWLLDIKTSRSVYESHVAQLGAIGAATDMAVEVPEGTEGAVLHKIVPSIGKYHAGQVDSWWVNKPLPEFTRYGILRVRPGDYDSDGVYVPPFCFIQEVDQGLVDVGFEIFGAGLLARHAQKRYKDLEKKLGEL